jgi:Flp pilus assembly protein TadG
MNWRKLKSIPLWNAKGNAGSLFGLCLLPLIAIIGSAHDVRQHAINQDKITHAVDVATVSAARLALKKNVDDAALKTKAKEVFEAETGDLSELGLNTLALERKGHLISVSVSGQAPTSMMRTVGKTKFNYSAGATAHFGEPLAVEVALVLDTSYSMQGSRLTALQEAASGMIDSLISANPETVKMSIVPFATYVNVGTDKRGEAWLNIAPDRSGRFERCSIKSNWHQANCTREGYSCLKDGVEKTCLRWNCLPGALKHAPKECETSAWTEQWHGCVKSRRPPYNTSDADYADEQIVGILTNGKAACPTPIRALTNNRDALIETINTLRADQNTYLATGLIWGLRTLSSTAPFQEAEPYMDYLSRRGRKALVLMSDGANTRSPKGNGRHSGQNRKKADKITKAVCDEIKSQGIELYTIAFELDDQDTKALLLECATLPRYFFDADSAQSLNSAFETISDNFSNVALVN